MPINLSKSEQVLFETNYPRVFRVVFLYCGSYYLAEEATQEAFYRACKNLHQLRDKAAFAGWVTAIAINILKTEFNKQTKIIIIDIEKIADELACNRNDYEIIELKEEVQYMLSSLDDCQKEVLILRYMLDLSINQISEIKKLSNGAVKSRLFRARDKLRQWKGEVADE